MPSKNKLNFFHCRTFFKFIEIMQCSVEKEHVQNATNNVAEIRQQFFHCQKRLKRQNFHS